MRKIESKIISLHSKFKVLIVSVKLGKIPNLEKKEKQNLDIVPIEFFISRFFQRSIFTKEKKYLFPQCNTVFLASFVLFYTFPSSVFGSSSRAASVFGMFSQYWNDTSTCRTCCRLLQPPQGLSYRSTKEKFKSTSIYRVAPKRKGRNKAVHLCDQCITVQWSSSKHQKAIE